MTDYVWPDDLPPFGVSYYLQPYTGGSESPFSRSAKVYGLAAPRWIASLSFRGGYDGTAGLEAVGARLDALIAKLEGRENRVSFWDFRRPRPRSKLWPLTAGNLAAAIGASALTITGLKPGTPAFAGDYVGGDGRAHIITDTVYAAGDGTASVAFKPPLTAAIAANAAVFTKASCKFRLTDDDAGANGVTVGDPVNMTLNFVEDI